MSIESSFRDLYYQAMQLVEERDRQISAILEECTVTLRGKSVNHTAIWSAYKSVEVVAADMVEMEYRLSRLQMPKERSLDWHLHHEALIKALQVQRYGYLIKTCRLALLARRVAPVSHPEFLILFEEASKCATESDVQQRLMLAECNTSRRFETIEYCYRESERAVITLGKVISKLHLQHVPAEENFARHHYQSWLITALKSYGYAHVMELWRQALMRKQRVALHPLPEEL
jgi:hypothetical protein